MCGAAGEELKQGGGASKALHLEPIIPGLGNLSFDKTVQEPGLTVQHTVLPPKAEVFAKCVVVLLGLGAAAKWQRKTRRIRGGRSDA